MFTLNAVIILLATIDKLVLSDTRSDLEIRDICETFLCKFRSVLGQKIQGSKHTQD